MQIYLITNLINHKIYVGKQKRNYENYFGSGLLISRAIKKYEIKNFKKEILQECCSLKCMNEAEKFWIKILQSQNPNIGYNIAFGGDGGFISYEISSKGGRNCGEIISEKIKNDEQFLNYWKEKSRNGYKNSLKNFWIGRKHKEETKEKMRISQIGKQKGEKNSQYGTCWIHKLKENKKIPKNKLEEFIKLGWIVGRT